VWMALTRLGNVFLQWMSWKKSPSFVWVGGSQKINTYFFLLKPTDALISQIYFGQETLHVSGSFSAHHQEFSTVHSVLVYVMQLWWHIPVPNVQWKTPDDGHRNCPKHVEFLDKNKCGKLVRLLILVKRNCYDARSHKPKIDQYLLGLGKKCDGTVVPFICPVLSYTLPGTSASRASYTDVDMKCVPGLAVFTSFLGFENWIKDSFRLFSGPSTRTFCSL